MIPRYFGRMELSGVKISKTKGEAGFEEEIKSSLLIQ